MSASRMSDARTHQIACILGMALVWPSIHNQLLYPLTFSFHKEGNASLYAYYLVYSLVMLATVLLVVFLNRKGIAQRLFSSKAALGLCGVLGCLGIVLLVVNRFNNGALSMILLGAGVGLSAPFVPVFFMFWSVQLAYTSERRVAFDLVFSYAVFCLITTIRLALGLHAWMFSIAYPLVSAALAVFVLLHPAKGRYALGQTPLVGLPLNLIVPSVILVYAATVIRCLLNPISATYDYPPFQRVVVYICLLALMGVLAMLYRPHGKIRRHADVIAFAVVTVFLLGAILLTGMATQMDENTAGSLGLGNFPVIAGINVVELFIWLLVLVNAQTKHTGIIRPAAAYLVLVVGASHLVSVLMMGAGELSRFDSSQVPVLAVTVCLAFLVAAVMSAVMAGMLYKSQQYQHDDGKIASSDEAATAVNVDLSTTGTQDRPPSGGAGNPNSSNVAATPACATLEADIDATERIRVAFGLSKRETDTLRLAIRNKSAKEIAESLFIAESTVNSHIKSIYRKCDVHSRKELIALASRYKKD